MKISYSFINFNRSVAKLTIFNIRNSKLTSIVVGFSSLIEEVGVEYMLSVGVSVRG